jgi:hypothetical protein
VIPRVLLGIAAIPGGGELRLFRRGDEFSIMLGANELMTAAKRVRRRRWRRWLVPTIAPLCGRGC